MTGECFLIVIPTLGFKHEMRFVLSRTCDLQKIAIRNVMAARFSKATDKLRKIAIPLGTFTSFRWHLECSLKMCKTLQTENFTWPYERPFSPWTIGRCGDSDRIGWLPASLRAMSMHMYDSFRVLLLRMVSYMCTVICDYWYYMHYSMFMYIGGYSFMCYSIVMWGIYMNVKSAAPAAKSVLEKADK